MSAIFGVVAWIATNLFAEPLLHFYKLRRVIRESVFFTANVSAEWDEKYHVAATEELRRHAASLEALWITAPKFVRRCLTSRGYDPVAAASGLTGLSNSFLTKRGERALHRDQTERGLKFPRTYTDEQIKSTRERLERDEP